MIPQSALLWLKENGYGAVSATHPVGGGCINHGEVLETASGDSFFLKTNSHTAPDMFAREVEGLKILRAPAGQDVADIPTVPQPFVYGPDFLLLEDLRPKVQQPDYWQKFGRRLAALHNYTHTQFGFAHNNYIGSTLQPNLWTDDGHRFFAEQRLQFQARLARQRGLLSGNDYRRVEQLTSRLSSLVPIQPASLVHGDLWTGNAMTDSLGDPAIIDPAAHYGWAEAELAMTTLFGSFPDVFYSAYQEVHPLEKGFRERFDLYNLYHLLNHLNLFGGGYLGQVLSVLRRYVK